MGVAVSLALVPALLPLHAQNSPPVPGASAFNSCRACHTLAKGGRDGLGPNLNGIFGRQAGAKAGFRYSPALKASNLRWDEQTLSDFLAAPTRKVPGTRMTIGMSDPAKRAALIAYLKVETAK